MPFYKLGEGDYRNIEEGFSRHHQKDFSKYAKGYYRAAKKLADDLLEKPGFGDYEGYPIVFLYRHALELHLKAFVFSTKAITKMRKDPGKVVTNGHDLPSLYGAFEKLLGGIPELKKDANMRMFLNSLKSVVQDFHEIDPASDLFRYPLGKDGNPMKRTVLRIGDIMETFEELEEGIEAITLDADDVEEKIRDEILKEYFKTLQGEEEDLKNL